MNYRKMFFLSMILTVHKTYLCSYIDEISLRFRIKKVKLEIGREFKDSDSILFIFKNSSFAKWKIKVLTS
ncbi:hypothetical protein LV85_00915 [Algoriphagus chordae]|uniref:Uncharacterized protein n=1 Tax=Algoriphagus chordae TaxID=237019 RepID=A0A2W7RBP2_9BACT|nr:hypothetical protein LV85_00915 [Algoriphagus chordae]